ncbi:unnamed protein product, partial [Amoebophrya sp. A120]
DRSTGARVVGAICKRPPVKHRAAGGRPDRGAKVHYWLAAGAAFSTGRPLLRLERPLRTNVSSTETQESPLARYVAEHASSHVAQPVRPPTLQTPTTARPRRGRSLPSILARASLLLAKPAASAWARAAGPGGNQRRTPPGLSLFGRFISSPGPPKLRPRIGGALLGKPASRTRSTQLLLAHLGAFMFQRQPGGLVIVGAHVAPPVLLRLPSLSEVAPHGEVAKRKVEVEDNAPGLFCSRPQ